MLKLLYILLLLLLSTCTAAAASPASSPEIKRQAAEHGEGLWKQIAVNEPRPETGSRGIIGYALALCEARMHPERLHRLFALVRSMQDADPKSKNCGNLRWYWRDKGVTDPNAIDFCMQDALTIWARHRDWLPADARDELDAFIRLGVQGCMQHRVPSDYTNIAILNCGSLIVAGERFNRADAAVEGRLRLDGILLYTAAFGIHEYDSPTYYGTDLSGLLMLHTLGSEQRERDQAEAMLKLFWTDIAANWLPDQQKLGGCHSRSYDYLRGIGALDWHLWAQGWLHEDKLQNGKPPSAERREPWGDEWKVPADIVALRDSKEPHYCAQRFGPSPVDRRWFYRDGEVSLSCAGSCYGSQDIPLAVDLAGARDAPRCYFIADGREDPYGKKKFPTGSAGHMKALHLQPFWTGTQEGSNATGIVGYRPSDLRDPQLTRLQSHFVFRRPTGGIWVDGKPISMFDLSGRSKIKPGKEIRLALTEGQFLVLRYGASALGIRVPWTHATATWNPAEIAIVDDGNALDCLRLTVDHGPIIRPVDGKESEDAPVVADEFRVRVLGNVTDEAKFADWRKNNPDKEISIGGKRDLINWLLGNSQVGSILKNSGREIGSSILEAVEPLRSLSHGVGFWKPIETNATGSTEWRASDGLVLPGMKTVNVFEVKDCVLQEPSVAGQPVGSVWWTLHVKKAGPYYLSARVQSKNNNHGSFLVAASDQNGPLFATTEWALHSAGKWTWQILRDASGHPRKFELPEGNLLLQLKTKASGTALDRIKLSTEAD